MAVRAQGASSDKGMQCDYRCFQHFTARLPNMQQQAGGFRGITLRCLFFIATAALAVLQ